MHCTKPVAGMIDTSSLIVNALEGPVQRQHGILREKAMDSYLNCNNRLKATILLTPDRGINM